MSLRLYHRADYAGTQAARLISGEAIDSSQTAVGISLNGGSSFGRWLRQQGKARGDTPSGLWLHVPVHTWSTAQRLAYATAFAAVLRAEGIAAFAVSKSEKKLTEG